MPDTVQHYTDQRADLLATLVLTRRKDVRLVHLEQGNDVNTGLDLIAHLAAPVPGLPADPYFGVQVVGTGARLDDAAAARCLANKTLRAMTARAFILAPVVLMAFSMEGDRGYWGWVVEPEVDGLGRPSLRRVERPDMTEISNASLDELYARVTAWFEVTGQLLLPQKNGR